MTLGGAGRGSGAPSLPDAPARARIATDLDTNLLVEAGAGSGKTTALVERMVALVETGTATVEEIAAVTFTRKAAGELRERFQGRLEERLGQGAADGAAGGAAGGAVDGAADRLRIALEEIDRAFIGTIHSFCARLLRERALDVGLDPAFRELAGEEEEELRDRFWAAYLERQAVEASPALEELAALGLGPARLRGLFDRLVDNPDVAFRARAVEPPSSAALEALRDELNALLDRGLEGIPPEAPGRAPDRLQKELLGLNLLRGLRGWDEPQHLFDALERIVRVGASTKGKMTQKRWTSREFAKEYRTELEAFCAPGGPAQELLSGWWAHRYAVALKWAREAADAFAAHRHRAGLLDFQDLLTLTRRMLRERPGARRALGLRYRRILVDEFQDTDPLQAEILLLLATEPADARADGRDGGDAGSAARRGVDVRSAEWRSAVPRKGALFVVGDPKQSIYRFRRADIELYGWVKERFRSFGDVLELTSNFRSVPHVGDLVNGVFDDPAFFPRRATPEQAHFEPLIPRRPADGAGGRGIFWYAVEPDGNRKRAIAEADAELLATWIHGRVDAGERGPGDFLVLTWGRKDLDVYARALEARSLPIQVTGAGITAGDELRELEILLECLLDPSDPVKVVAALVGLFFGLGYDVLLDHRRRGGGFDVTREDAAGQPVVREALAELRRWWRRATRQPSDVFLGELVAEIGLLPYTAAGEVGALRAGLLSYALDVVAATALSGDATLRGALAAVQATLARGDVEAPLEPGREDVVRVMNLHQAKGLEAGVVVLANPAAPPAHPPGLHIERTVDGGAVGYTVVHDSGRGRGGVVLARPMEWPEKEATEQAFARAEDVRKLYVAVTRARDELVVARMPGGQRGGATSAWAPLDDWLDAHATRLEMEARAAEPREELSLEPAEVEERVRSVEKRRARAAEPTYVIRAVTDVTEARAADREAHAADAGAGATGATGATGAAAPASGAAAEAGRITALPAPAFRGLAWGSVVHAALAEAAAAPPADALRATCRWLLIEHERPLDARGEPVELDELLGVVEAVRSSELWARADAAERRLVEVPFALAGEALGGGVTEAGSAAAVPAGGDDAGALPTEILEGVIDLVFREPDGWVVVDYKTDVGADPGYPARFEGYRRQVELYVHAWERLTGEPVKERILFLTTQGRLETW